MSELTISAEDAAELFELADGERHGEWMRITDQTGDSSRWREHHLLVISNGGGHFGIPFALGLTENQDHELPWEKEAWTGKEPGPITLTPLVGVQVTSTEYLTEQQYKKRLAKGGAE